MSTALNFKKKYTTCDLVIDALFVALVLLFTKICIPNGYNGGLVHLGNVPLFLAAFTFGKRTGAICGAIGMAAFDVITNYVPWAPITFITVGLMGYVVGLFAEKWPKFWAFAVSTLIALVIKLAGYYIGECILCGNFIAPLASVPGNIVQIVVALVIAWPLALPMRKLLRYITHYEH